MSGAVCGALGAPQDRCDGWVELRYHHYPLHVVAKGKWYRDVDNFTGVERDYILVDNEI